MVNPRANQIGLVAHYSDQGNWAFNEAFELAKRKDLQLNIFCFSETTFNKPFDLEQKDTEDVKLKEILLAEERKLREHFDDMLDDYVDVGFKLCSRKKHNFELKSCMIKNEFQILVIPFIDYDMKMDDMPIKDFAGSFGAPVILIGPEKEDQYHINYPADLLLDLGSLPDKFSDPKLVTKIPAGHMHVKF
ncbi:MAG: hypothetical protein GY863_18500 [bacterium]|nr:hypothetical protein [bacterium]